MLKLNYVLNRPDHQQILSFTEDDLITEEVNGLEIWKPAEKSLNGILTRRSDLLKLKCYTTLCCFSSVIHGFLIKILDLLSRGKIPGHLESVKVRKKQYSTTKSFKKKG